jgi:hypothetical protein
MYTDHNTQLCLFQGTFVRSEWTGRDFESTQRQHSGKVTVPSKTSQGCHCSWKLHISHFGLKALRASSDFSLNPCYYTSVPCLLVPDQHLVFALCPLPPTTSWTYLAAPGNSGFWFSKAFLVPNSSYLTVTHSLYHFTWYNWPPVISLPLVLYLVFAVCVFDYTRAKSYLLSLLCPQQWPLLSTQ